MNMKLSHIFLASTLAISTLQAAVEFPGKNPGKAEAQVSNGIGTIGNKLFTATFRKSGSGVVFGGMKTANGKELAKADTNIFTLNLKNGTKLTSKEMKCQGMEAMPLAAEKNSFQLGKRFPGQSLTATFTDSASSLTVEWKAILRNGSHYLRQEFTIKAGEDVAFENLIPLEYDIVQGGTPVISGDTTHGKVVINNLIFTGLETPMSVMSAGGKETSPTTTGWNPEEWTPNSFGGAFEVSPAFKKVYPPALVEQREGPTLKHLAMAEGPVYFSEGGKCKIKFNHSSGKGRLTLIGVQLLDAEGKQIIFEDVHKGIVGKKNSKNTYMVEVPGEGSYTIRYWADIRKSPVFSKGNISYSLPLGEAKKENTSGGVSPSLVVGKWIRRTVLQKGQSWEVSSVLGFIAPKQQRRSFLAYSEREKASLYRPFIHYNDWYEIGIRVHDNPDPLKRTSEGMWLDVLATWEREMVKKRKTFIDAFVIDDGWDEFNSLWDFHKGFPNGFSKMNEKVTRMKAGLGTWLGPVGGYGSSKSMRLAHWNKTHPNNQIGSFQLSNKEYFDAFVGRCTQMVKDYDMRYFKFDGISTHFHSHGPAGLEDAEGIIRILSELRKARHDLFINTSVGTWASPFWFHYADSIWRQENDFDVMGDVGDPRDKWITYRDRLVHDVFVQGAPLFPINSIMTHGIIITNSPPANVMSKSPANCIKEMRTAFGCGSALQEIYVDRELMMQENGKLWDELVDCIRWIRRNADVLDDVHWVGGNPWDKEKAQGDIYGWAAWNKEKCTLTLRNSDDEEKTLHSTLRAILDVPPGVKCKVAFRNSFSDQRTLPGLVGEAINVDKSIEITLKPFEVIVLEGKCALEKDKKKKKKKKKA